MPGWNQEKVDALMYGISRSYPTAGPLEISIGFFLLLSFSLLLWWHHQRRAGRMLSTIKQESQRIWQSSLESMQLSNSELVLLELMRESLSDDFVRVHRMLKEHKVFELAQQSVLKKQPDLQPRLQALELKLGLSERQGGRLLQTTRGLPVDTSIWWPNGQVLGRIVRVQADGLWLEVADSQTLESRIISGRPYLFHIRRDDGLYEWQTAVLAERDGYYMFAHQDQLERKHRRAFRRQAVQLTARLDGLHAQVLDLSGGGAFLRFTGAVPGKYDPSQQEEGTQVLWPLSIALAGQSIRIQVRIVEAVSQNMRVAFEKIREGDRDRIIRYLHAQQREA